METWHLNKLIMVAVTALFHLLLLLGKEVLYFSLCMHVCVRVRARA
jgi:hypothetical protein